MILIICYNPAFGAADNICRAFRSQGIDSELLYKEKDPYGRTDVDDLGRFFNCDTFHWTKGDHIIFAGLTSLQIFWHTNRKRTTPFLKNNVSSIVIGETEYRRNPEQCNELLDELSVKYRFCSFDLLHLGKKNVPFFYPMQYDAIDKIKNERMTVCFSPGMGRREERKGTLAIEKGIELAKQKIDFDFDFVMKVSHLECLRRKAKAHIFIDQINTEVGGIGKNGLEAIALNCVTLCSINKLNNSFRRYPIHPIINVESSKWLAEVLINLKHNPDKLSSMQKKTEKWKHCFNYKSTVDYMRSVWNQ